MFSIQKHRYVSPDLILAFCPLDHKVHLTGMSVYRTLKPKQVLSSRKYSIHTVGFDFLGLTFWV